MGWWLDAAGIPLRARPLPAFQAALRIRAPCGATRSTLLGDDVRPAQPIVGSSSMAMAAALMTQPIVDPLEDQRFRRDAWALSLRNEKVKRQIRAADWKCLKSYPGGGTSTYLGRDACSSPACQWLRSTATASESR